MDVILQHNPTTCIAHQNSPPAGLVTSPNCDFGVRQPEACGGSLKVDFCCVNRVLAEPLDPKTLKLPGHELKPIWTPLEVNDVDRWH
jgi:hypothetical protein